MTTKLALASIIFGGGMLLALHFSMNAAVGEVVKNPRMANAVFWIIGACVAVAIGLSGWDSSRLGAMTEVPKWLWLAGVIGASIVFLVMASIPRIGAGTTNIALLAGQVLGAMLIAHYGLLESPIERLNLARIAGAVLMIGGAVLVIFGRVPFISE